jgi:hypothetical protein
MMRMEDVSDADQLGKDRSFDWENDPSVILHDQAAVDACFTKSGELVVKQRDTLGAPDVDVFLQDLSIEPGHAGSLVSSVEAMHER